MTENNQPQNNDNDLEPPATQAQDQELDDKSLEEVNGGTTSVPTTVVTGVSNVLKTRHDTVKNSIGNIR